MFNIFPPVSPSPLKGFLSCLETTCRLTRNRSHKRELVGACVAEGARGYMYWTYISMYLCFYLYPSSVLLVYVDIHDYDIHNYVTYPGTIIWFVREYIQKRIKWYPKYAVSAVSKALRRQGGRESGRKKNEGEKRQGDFENNNTKKERKKKWSKKLRI